MIEKLVTSKTRIKILKLFLNHIDDRYYLRELERLLDESLSPLRRQLVKLTGMGILITEEEANLKYYRLNKNFDGLEELRGLVLGKEIALAPRSDIIKPNDIYAGNGLKPFPAKQFRYDLALLSFISVFVLATAIFVVYTNTKNVKLMTGLVSKNTAVSIAKVRPAAFGNSGEMMSKKWKVMPGNIPVLSSGEMGEEKKSEEL